MNIEVKTNGSGIDEGQIRINTKLKEVESMYVRAFVLQCQGSVLLR